MTDSAYKMRVRLATILCVILISSFVFGVALGKDEPARTKDAPLTNAHVIAMVKASLDESIIIAKIRSSPKNFDLSPEGLIELKQAGVSNKIMEAMMGGAPPSTEASPGQVPARGDFFLLKEGKLTEIPEHPGVQDVGIRSGKYVLKEKQASFRIPYSSGSLQFVSKIKIDPAGMQGGDLFKLGLLKKNSRYLAMKIILTSPGAGETFPEFKTQYDVSTNPDGTITITTKGPLQPGEYAFAIGAVMQASVRFFDFGIDPQ